MAKRGQRRGAEIFMEEGGNLHGGGWKSLKRGAEMFEEGGGNLGGESGGNQREVVGRSTLYWATNEQGLGHNQQYASALVKHYTEILCIVTIHVIKPNTVCSSQPLLCDFRPPSL